MNLLKRLLAVLLAAALLLGGIAVFAAPSLTITAINDAFLPLNSSYMPTRIGGEYFVPYAAFGSGLGLRTSYDSGQQMLVLSGNGRTLTFLIAQGYVYNQDMKTYDTPAYSLNGQIYIPVRVVCSCFGLSYSLIQSTSAQILRICGSGAVLSDSSFLNSNKTRLNDLVSAYNGNSAEEKPPEAQAEETHKPSLVYLAFFNAPGAHTAEILDILQEYGRTATFFITAGQADLDTGLLRRIVGEGHFLGLAVNASTVPPEELIKTANQTNQWLLEETGTTTRIVTPLAGSEALTDAQLEALIAAGYRLWDTTLDSRDNSYSAYASASTVTTAFTRTDSPVVVRFRDRDATAGALRNVLGYMRTNSISSAGVTVLRAPINARGDVR